jgi:phosphomannomutase
MDFSIVKANDIRGIVPTEWNKNDIYEIGKGFATFLKSNGLFKTLVGRDMRLCGKELKTSFIKALVEDGISIVDIDLCSTDQMNFASGSMKLPAAIITASHNPKEYNGLKFMLPGARPIGSANGLLDIVDNMTDKKTNEEKIKGTVEKVDTVRVYAQSLRELVKGIDKTRKMKIVVDAGNAMAGLIVPEVFNSLQNIKIISMYFELDGNFPNHPPNPLNFENLKDLQKKVIKEKADLGLAFDGDADRCFMIDEKGNIINPSSIICEIASVKVKYLLKRDNTTVPTIIRNLITSKIVDKSVNKSGGATIVSKVGHSFIKESMRNYESIFGGEHSAHYYFKEFYYADSGMLAALNFIKILDENRKSASKINKKYSKYFQSGEINLKNNDSEKTIKKLEDIYEKKCKINHLDGLTISNWDNVKKRKRWWANIRLSNTEPLLRINIEAVSKKKMKKISNEILANIKKYE